MIEKDFIADHIPVNEYSKLSQELNNHFADVNQSAAEIQTLLHLLFEEVNKFNWSIVVLKRMRIQM